MNNIENLKERYSNGECFFLALAINRNFGLPCVIFWSDDENEFKLHVANKYKDSYLDIYGIVTKEDLKKRYGTKLIEVFDADGSETLSTFEVEISEVCDNEDIAIEEAWNNCEKLINQAINSVIIPKKLTKKRK